MTAFDKCTKPDCRRKVPPGTLYCCASCDKADNAPAPYELDPYNPDALPSHWILMHSRGCEERAAERGEFASPAL